jgi:hypothetical protein
MVFDQPFLLGDMQRKNIGRTLSEATAESFNFLNASEYYQ